MQTVLSCKSLLCQRDHWRNGSSRVNNISASFLAGEFLGIAGPDGCGKGLFLNLLGLLEPPDAGRVLVENIAADSMDETEVRRLRNETFGFVFNHPYLLPSFTVIENVAMPLFRLCGGDTRMAKERTQEVLAFCGISHLESRLAERLTVSEQWAVALARALVHSPSILIAISPQGASDVLVCARRAATELGLAVIWSGEAETLTPFVHRMMFMNRGQLMAEHRS